MTEKTNLDKIEFFDISMVELHPIKLCHGSLFLKKLESGGDVEVLQELCKAERIIKLEGSSGVNNYVEKNYMVIFSSSEAVMISISNLGEFWDNNIKNCVKQSECAGKIICEINKIKGKSSDKFKKLTEKIAYKVKNDSYTFHILYVSDNNLKNTEIFKNKDILTAVLDRSLVIYKKEDEENSEKIKMRIDKGFKEKKFDFTEQIENRSEYSCYASWSLMLILDYSQNKDCFIEMVLIEAQLQYQWYKIYRLSTKKRFFNYLKIKDLKRQMNSIENAGDSNRMAQIKAFLIKSSRVDELAEMGKERGIYNQQILSILISCLSFVISIAALVISIVKK